MPKGRALFAVLAVLLVATAGCASLVDSFKDAAPGVGDQGPGAKHDEYLAGDADTLLVEVSHSPGALWDEDRSAREDFVRQVERITQKDVEIVEEEELPAYGENYRYSTQELRDFHDEYQDHEDDEDTVVMHALFLDGKLEKRNDDSVVIGLAFGEEAWALFKGEIREMTCNNDAVVCDGVREWRVTRSVAIHEAGHVFGLVGCPLEMTVDRQDRGCHSSNEDSVMYWGVEVRRGLQNLIGEQEVPWTFDQNDVSDARAIQ